MQYKLIRFDGEMNRSADLEIVEIVNEEDWSLIQKAIEEGKELYLGEIAGKHSEVIWTLEADEIKVLSEDQDDIESFRRIAKTSSIGPFELAYEVRKAYGLELE